MEKILVLDDEAQIRELLRRTLEHEGYAVITVPDVSQALGLTREQSFDLILLDLRISEKAESGLVFLKKIRDFQSKIPIVIYSGYVTEEIEKKARLAGANEVLTKDISMPHLVERIKKIVKVKERFFEPHAQPKDKKILVVDDEEGVRHLLRDFFKTKGYEVLEADDGEMALQMVRVENPSVVLLDLNMPGMGGLAALKQLRELKPDLGVVVVTGRQDDAAVSQAMDLGAYSYVIKPFDFLYLDLVVSSKILIAE